MSQSEPEIRLTPRISIVKATEQHIDDIAPRMREDDAREVWAMQYMTPSQALARSLWLSDYTFAGLVDGRAEVMWGVGSLSPVFGVGMPWLLGTDAVIEHKRVFLRGSRQWIDIMLSRYEELTNFVDDRNEVTKKWLQWLGFTLSEPTLMGYEQVPFRQFTLRRS